MEETLLSGQKSEELVPATLPDNIRPWGRYDVIDGDDGFQVKRITILPGQRVSYQRHRRREEFWMIVRGSAVVTLNDLDTSHKAGEVIHVKLRDKHRIGNSGDGELIFIEVQMGDYFGEDDIERFEDAYGREGTTTPHGN
ncbi:phosphomannose isomerase type II C-terminal cupin domain [Candidatus Uhrbacteria bacterium]|nr:phosphomannose isomerase type II C-terminal cupin domain [Candidatus Uhrbacteria bacterium]